MDGIESFGSYYVRISGPGGVAQWSAPGPDGPTDWVSLQAPIREADWNVISGSWGALLQQVDEMRVVTEIVAGMPEIDGLDNVGWC